MAVIYTEKFFFWDVPNDDERGDGWSPDCGGKWDFDPSIVHLSSRVWRDGSYISSVTIGGDTCVSETGICHAENQAEAMRAVEKWSHEQADKILAAVKALYAAATPLKEGE